MAKDKRSIVEFLLITFALSSICYAVMIRGGESASGMTAVLMWCPGVAALIVRARHYRHEPLLGWTGCRPVYLLAGVLIPAVYLGLSYGIFWLLTPGAFSADFSYLSSVAANAAGKSGASAVGIVITLLILILSANLTAAGEEIGWRGFLLPQMTKLWSVKAAVLVSGLIWAAWHMPLMLAGLYLPGTPLWFMLPMFVFEILAITAVLAVLRLKSGSVWPAILLHGFHNFFDQAIFGPLTSGAAKAYFVGETGVITLLVTLLIAYAAARLFWQGGLPAHAPAEVVTISSSRLGDD